MSDNEASPLNVRYRSFSSLVLMVLNICMSPFYFGYNLAYFGTFEFKTLVEIFGITLDENLATGLLQGCIPIGGGIGALSSFLLLKYFSRKNSLIVVGVISMLGMLLIQIPNQGTLILGRFIQGICVGFYSALSPMLIKEFSPTQISGTLGAINQFFIAFGVFFANFLMFILLKINDDEKAHWRIVFGLTLLTVSLQILLLLFVYRFETPKYLLENGQEDECRKVLHYIYKEEFVEEVLLQKKRDLGLEEDESPQNKGGSGSIITESQTDVSEPLLKQSGNKKFNKLRLIIAIHLALLQQFVGINVVVAYGTDIATQIFSNLKHVIPVLLNLEQVITSFLTGYLLVKFGRKSILQVGTITGAVSLILIAVGFIFKDSKDMSDTFGNALIMIGLVIFMANFGLSLGPIVWLYIPEILEPRYISISTLMNWAAAAVIMFLYPVLKNVFGSSVPLFFFFAAWCIVSFFIGQKFIIETKGKQQKDIFIEYDKLSNSGKAEKDERFD